MPTKENPWTLGPGTVYIGSGDGGELTPLGHIQEAEITEESEIDILGDMKPKRIVATPPAFTLTAHINPEDWERMQHIALMAEIRWRVRKLWEEMCALYPNRRVVHLANHHRDRLVRKKNIKRIQSYFSIEFVKE